MFGIACYIYEIRCKYKNVQMRHSGRKICQGQTPQSV